MSDQAMNEPIAEESPVRVAEGAPPSTPSSGTLLPKIAILLLILVAGLLTVFAYYASSICITVVLAGFLAILFDPVVVALEKLHLPRSVAAAGIVLAGMSLIVLLGYVLYGKRQALPKNFRYTPRRFSKPLSPSPEGSKPFSKVPETLRMTCIPPRESPRFGSRNRQTGPTIWCAA
jgi:hypothetical protein